MGGSGLVLGGGALTGGAWMAGMLAGLAEAGLDLTDAGTIWGTSAGAVLGAQLVSVESPAELYTAHHTACGDPLGLRMTLSHTVRYLLAALTSRTPEAAGRRLGRMARRSRTVSAAEVATAIDALVPVRTWPDERLRVTAVDACTGRFGTLGAGSGLPLQRALAASCALPGLWPPVEDGERQWMDGGVRSSTNADAAGGCDRVVVLAPFPAVPGPGRHAARQVAELTANGSRAVLLTPDRASRGAMGRNPLEPTRRPAAAEAGRAQARTCFDAVSACWREAWP